MSNTKSVSGCALLPMRCHLGGEPGLDDAHQSQCCKATEAVHFNQLPDQTHTQYTLQRGDPYKMCQTQTLYTQSTQKLN